MINIRLATEGDRVGWNRVAYESPEATYAHTWEWKEVIEDGLGLESIYLVAEYNNEIVGIYPAFLRHVESNNRFFNSFFKKFNIMWSPLDLTWDYGGPCILSGVDENVLEKLIEGMEKSAINIGAISIKISAFDDNKIKQYLSERKYKKSIRQTFIVDIGIEESKLLSNVAKRARKYVNVAKRNNIIVKEVSDESNIKEIYKCISHTHQRVGAYIPPFDFFLKIKNKFANKKLVIFRVAQIDDKVIGGDVLFCFNNVVVERYRGIYDEYLDLRTNYLMVWTAIEESKRMGYRKYDLGGVSAEAKGIYFFKSRWGGELINTDWYKKDINYEKIRNFVNWYKQ